MHGSPSSAFPGAPVGTHVPVTVLDAGSCPSFGLSLNPVGHVAQSVSLFGNGSAVNPHNKQEEWHVQLGVKVEASMAVTHPP